MKELVTTLTPLSQNNRLIDVLAARDDHDDLGDISSNGLDTLMSVMTLHCEDFDGLDTVMSVMTLTL
jgi:hypothetical protein